MAANNLLPPFFRPYYKNPLFVDRAKGTVIWDKNSTQYLDCYAGVATVALGHCNSQVDEAVTAQIRKFGHLSALYMSDILNEYLEALVGSCRPTFERAYLVNSGSESVDLAISLARVTAGSMQLVALAEGYHGGTYLSKSANGLKTWHFDSDQAPDIVHVTSPIGEVNARSCIAEAEGIFSKVNAQGGRPIFILEPVLGVGGIVKPPNVFFSSLNELIARYNGLLIVDEVQTGFGRCGDSLFAYQKFGIKPDLMALGKGIANGYPLGAVLMTDEVAQANQDLLHFSTFGGHPMSLAAAKTTLAIINKPEFLATISQRGNKFRKLLQEKIGELEGVRAIRGIGYMTGVEFDTEERAKAILNGCYEKKLLVGMGGRMKNVVRLQPALIFTDEEYEQVANILVELLGR